MTPMVFCSSEVPCDSAIMDAETVWAFAQPPDGALLIVADTGLGRSGRDRRTDVLARSSYGC